MRELKIKRVLVFLMVVITLVLPQTEIKAITKSEAKKEITRLEKEVKKLKSQKVTAVKNEKKQSKGATFISGGIVCYSPFVVKDYLGSYYYVKNAKYMDSLVLLAQGYVKLTGETTVYYDKGIPYNCYVCNSVNVSKKSSKIQDSIDKKNKKIKEYKNALKDVYVLSSQTWNVGDEYDIGGEWKYSGKYNNLKFTSSDKSIATVDSDGNVKALRAGTVTISAKASLSGKVSKCTLKICDVLFGEEEGEEYEESDSFTLCVWSSLVTEMEISDGYLIIKAVEDEYYGGAFSKNDKPMNINEITYPISEECKWKICRYDYSKEENIKEQTTFEEISTAVKLDRASFLEEEYLNPFLMDVVINNGQVIEVSYASNR